MELTTPTRTGAPLPSRIQLSRAAGWRLPLNTAAVGRPSKWGNPFRIGALIEDPDRSDIPPQPHTGNLKPGIQGVGCLGAYSTDPGASYLFTVRAVANRADAVALFIAWAARAIDEETGRPFADAARVELAGRDLACWCPLPSDGRPDICHAAVLLDLAAGRRMSTPDVPLPEGGTRITMKRSCNGCGEPIGDVTIDELTAGVSGRQLPDVRGECPRCSADVTTPAAARQPCGCCEINDYDPAPGENDPDYSAAFVPGSCMNCGHSPEEHQ